MDLLKPLNLQKFRNVTWTIGANAVTSLAKMLVFIVSVPLLMNYLGTEKYGLIATITSMCIWLNTIADGGVGLSLKNELVKENALNGITPRLTQLISTGLFFILVLTVVIGLIGSILILNMDWQKILNIGFLINQTPLIIFILLIFWSVLLYIPFSFPRVVYAALQKEYLFAPWSIVGSLLGLLLIVYSIKLDFGLTLVGSAIPIGALAGALLSILWFQFKMKSFQISIKNIRWNLLGNLTKFGLDFFILQITAVIIFQTDVFIVNYFLGQNAAANYSLHFQIFVYFQMLMTLLTNPFWPVFGHAFHNKEIIWLKKLIIILTSAVAFIALAFSLLVNYFGPSMMAIWSHHHITWSPSLGLALSAYSFISVTTCFLSMILNSLSISKEPKNFVVMQALLNIIFSVYLVNKMGMLGVALGSLISCLLTLAWYIPLKLFNSMKQWVIPA